MESSHINTMSLPELTNLQIESKEKGDRKFGGVFCRDDIPSSRKMKGKWFIVNLDTLAGPGTHWVLVYNCRPQSCYYFDSYGVEPPVEVAKFMFSTKKKNCEYNDFRLQLLGSTQCGWWCMYIAKLLNSGADFTQIIHSFANASNPDKELASLTKRH